MKGESLTCPKCKKAWEEKYRINIFNGIQVCTECGIMEWIHDGMTHRREIWQRKIVEKVRI